MIKESEVVLVHNHTDQQKSRHKTRTKTHGNLAHTQICPFSQEDKAASSTDGLGKTGQQRKENEAGPLLRPKPILEREKLLMLKVKL